MKFLVLMAGLLALGSVASHSIASRSKLYSKYPQVCEQKDSGFVPGSLPLNQAIGPLATTAHFFQTEPLLQSVACLLLPSPQTPHRIHLYGSSGLSPPKFS